MIARKKRVARCGELLALVIGHALTAVAAPTAVAATDTDALTVSVTVQSGYSLNGGTLDFGVYVSGQATDLDATGAIGFTNCNGTLVVELDGGGSGSVMERRLRSGSDGLSYQLFRSASRSAVWGSGSEAQEVILLTPQSGQVQVYGRISGGQSVPDGIYTDVVNVTLNF